LLALAAVTALLYCAPALAWRCDGGLVDVGDNAVVVVHKCGEPQYRESLGGGFFFGFGYVPAAELWYYNRGSSRLLRILRFRDGTLEAIETDGYGFDPDAPGDCRPLGIHAGMSAYELLSRCGEPARRDTWVEYVDPRARRHPLEAGELVRVQRWIYPFDASHFLREVYLRNGRVWRVETGERLD
jgi:hypothetical protein